MAILRLILAVLMPPLGIWNRGCVTVLLVGLLSAIVWFFAYLNNVLLLAYWIPGVLVAIFMVLPDLRKTPAPTEDRSRDILGAASALKNQSLPSESPFTSQQVVPRPGRRPPPATPPTAPPAAPPTPSPKPSDGPPKPPWED